MSDTYLRLSNQHKWLLRKFRGSDGLYAVVATLVLAGILLMAGANKESNGLLWTTLLIVWALTVPHMVATSRFDVNSLTIKF